MVSNLEDAIWQVQRWGNIFLETIATHSTNEVAQPGDMFKNQTPGRHNSENWSSTVT